MRHDRAFVVLVAVLLAVAVPTMAQTYAGNKDVTWIVNEDQSLGWLYVQNGGTIALTTVRLALEQPAVIEGGYTTFWDGSYQYVLLPTGLAPGEHVALTVAGAGGKQVGLKGVALGDYYSWFTVPAGTQATVSTLVGGPVVLKSADGLINSLFIVNPETSASFLRVDGSGVVIGGGLTAVSQGSSVYVMLAQPTTAGGVTAVQLLGGEIKSAEFGYWTVWSVDAGATSTVVTVYNMGSSAANALSITLFSNATVDTTNSFVHKADGTSVAVALTATDPRGFDIATASGGRLQRLWLPVQVLPGESVAVKIDVVDAPIKVFGVGFGNITN